MAQYTFKAFNPTQDIISGKSNLQTYPIWTDLPSDADTLPQAILTSMYTSSTEILTSSTWEANYYYNIYNQDVSANQNAEVQFSIAFGTTSSIQLNNTLGEQYNYTYPSRAIYAQFLSILENATISNPDNYWQLLQSGSTTEYDTVNIIYAITIARSRIKDTIELDTWQLNLSGSTGILNLITTQSSAGSYSVPIVTGIIGGTSPYTGPTGSIDNNIQLGIFYPQRGMFILDAAKIHSYIGAGVPGYDPSAITASTSYDPSASLMNFYELLKNGETSGSTTGSYFRARTTENVQSTHYFCRVMNSEFNYSTNPTWVSGSNNAILDEFYTEPRTFITTVGLYDGDANSGQLVAVAKVSRPIPKDGESEALIKVRLDF